MERVAKNLPVLCVLRFSPDQDLIIPQALSQDRQRLRIERGQQLISRSYRERCGQEREVIVRQKMHEGKVDPAGLTLDRSRTHAEDKLLAVTHETRVELTKK